MKKSTLILASLATLYSGYKIYKYRSGEVVLSTGEKLLVGALGTIGIGTFIYWSTTGKK